jgi:hypothetical protein
MSPSSSQPWSASFQARRRGGQHPGVRASDAERTEVTDLLSKHYSDGRLDQSEFDERMQKAMNAKTHADFNGLFDDLPDMPGTEGTKAPPIRRRQRQQSSGVLGQIFLIVLVVGGALIISHAIITSFTPWLLVVLLAFLWLRSEGSRKNR